MMRANNNELSKLNNKAMKNISGNSMPVVLIVFLVVMIIGSAVAYSTVQVFSIVRSEEHNQMTYIAAESAVQRSISSLDKYLTKEEFATDRGIVYTGEVQFINTIVSKLNAGDSQIKNSFSGTNGIPVYADLSMNYADVSLSFAWDGSTFTRLGNKLKFPLEITAVAKMENGMFKSYGRKVVALKEYEVWLYNPFKLDGAVYTLGDFVAQGSGISTINGNVYVFGTGLDKPNRMDQYHMGGICADESAILHIQEGSAFTRNQLRVGDFYETGTDKCAIIVDRDVVAQSIQAFGNNDDIVIIGDAYTFDDIEMNGANSYIAINGNFFGVNPGDGNFHDTSSAVVNTSPLYAPGVVNDYTNSRIVINGYTFINGSTFRMNTDGTVGHKLEDVSLAWDGTQPAYIGINKTETTDYMAELAITENLNGFSVLLGNVGWSNNTGLSSDWTLWNSWITEIKGATNGRRNVGLTYPAKIDGFSHHAMAANDKLYISGETNINVPMSVTCRINNDVDGLGERPLDGYIHSTWIANSDSNMGIPKGLENMMSLLESHVQVFARKSYPGLGDGSIDYSFNSGMMPDGSFGSTTEFLRIKSLLDDIDSAWGCIQKFTDDGDDNLALSPVYLVDYLETKYSDLSKYLLVINLDPNRELIIDRDTVNGIIFTMGKLTIKNGATLNGAVIVAGPGYDTSSGVRGSASDSYYYDHDGDASTPMVKTTRLPRVVGNTNVSNFRNWDYAALVIDNGNIVFPGREALFNEFDEVIGSTYFKDILKGIF